MASRRQGEIDSRTNRLLHVLWVLPVIYMAIVNPLLRDTGVTMEKHFYLSKVMTDKYYAKFKSKGIGYLRSGSGSLMHGDRVSLYSSYRGGLLQVGFASWDYGAGADTPHMHIILENERLEVRYDVDIDTPFEQQLSQLERVIKFSFTKLNKNIEA